MIALNTKERMLLEDEKSHEQLCVEKYQDYSNRATDPELKNLFAELSQKEQQHLDSINQLLNGVLPNITQQQDQQQQNQISDENLNNIDLGNIMDVNLQITKHHTHNAYDKMLCQDSLSTEKYVSSTYNTAIFEFRDKNIRQILNHIQKEEQEHGEKIYNYMHQHGMYN